MSRPNHGPPRSANRLLAALPPKDYARLAPDLESVTLMLGDAVDTPGTPTRYAYFPTTAVISMLCTMRDGSMVETGMMGREGTTGGPVCLGMAAASPYTIVQVSGEAFRIRASKLKAEFDRGGAFHDVLLRYVHALGVQVSQSVGCNTHHLLEARLSRWLLIVLDRVPSGDIFLRHEFLAQMLGTGRSAVTIAAGSLRNAGLIRYARGRITVLNRTGLEASACECYGVVKDAFERARLG